MTTAHTRPVGIDIQESDDNRALVDAIALDNPEMTVRHLPGLMKLSAPGRIEINRETIEDRLGREWETGEFQLAIVTYTGNFAEWDDDQIIVAWDH
ncbi:monooxygenase [Gordonia amarae]|uniref:Monooxygenase n=2 Tax=Gordonia amarae TaxID=36821 RepID=A0A857L2U6_9ACTN|nr:MmoB/DmpM family protein [Gordonia amarae]MCS3876475.1 phenol hydroxylase P2 protein [Gordonia amarae]QHN19385.1 monooxygenase [Gordonia amarae]QHN23861.1 monooxygenase [Gordonia amarae]QHN41490.1 monooxygenase [Gordonia amarae]GAB04594.1 putative phenol hydroxylase component [Gordonia amarae NBRC 15530]